MSVATNLMDRFAAVAEVFPRPGDHCAVERPRIPMELEDHAALDPTVTVGIDAEVAAAQAAWMRLALVEADRALAVSEVPIGAVFVRHERLSSGALDWHRGTVVASGYNRTNIDKNVRPLVRVIVLV